MTQHRTLPITAPIAASLLLTALTWGTHAQAPAGRQAAVDREVEGLKAAYLRCEQAATERLLGFDDAAKCSTIYERLLKVGFGGNFRLLLAWWQGERVSQTRSGRIDSL
jgi:hypothetical protein